MPLVSPSLYQPPRLLRSGHLQTFYPALFRRVRGVVYHRRRIDTPDGDFIDLDLSTVGTRRAGIIAHGLEGHSQRSYVKGMVRALNACGWDAVVWNFRGCSGEPNRKLRFYHSGDTGDLETVFQAVRSDGRWDAVAMIGFSMGGNVILKYLGERGGAVDPLVRGAAVFSVPCDLASAAHRMAAPENTVYMKRFLRDLRRKIVAKAQHFPGKLSWDDFDAIRSFRDFDERYTAPLHGFQSARDYWTRASSRPWIPGIKVPSLLVNALDDPFLAPPCFPHAEARESAWFHLEAPGFGGHVGFMNPTCGDGLYWSEQRALEFLTACT